MNPGDFAKYAIALPHAGWKTKDEPVGRLPVKAFRRTGRDPHLSRRGATVSELDSRASTAPAGDQVSEQWGYEGDKGASDKSLLSRLMSEPKRARRPAHVISAGEGERQVNRDRTTFTRQHSGSGGE